MERQWRIFLSIIIGVFLIVSINPQVLASNLDEALLDAIEPAEREVVWKN